MRPSHTNLVLDTLRNSFSAPLTRQGVMLSHDDSQTTLEVYQQWLLLLVDLGYLDPVSLKRSATRLLTDMVKVDVLDLNNTFAECLHLLRLQTTKGFKVLCSKISGHLYPLIKDDLPKILVGDVRVAKKLMQIFAFTSRLSLQDIDLSQQMIEDYKKNEDFIPDSFNQSLINRLNKIIRRWMKTFDPSAIHCCHGKGAVAFLGRASLETKYTNLCSDQMLRYAFSTEQFYPVNPNAPLLERISETRFVAKSYKAFRTISMEPPSLMYVQEGVWHEIERVVLREPYLRRHIAFDDQERNRRLAQRGSIERNFATIDLSAASDLVSYELVKQLFRGTKLLRYLFACRSRFSRLPDGEVLPLRKFAPMGSALCFPIETLVFASVCELVTQELRFSGQYSVYGDDIIVPTSCVGSAMRLLESLGFRINYEKSFYHNTCWFRESCGGEYCDGFDVTPIRVARKYSHRERDVRLESLIDSANRAYTLGFRNLRSFYLRRIRALRFIPLFSPRSLLSDNYTNYHTVKRWNKDLQCIQVKVSDPSLRYRKDDLLRQDESIRLRHWFESTFERQSLDFAFVSNICKPTKSFRNTWMTKPYEPSDQEFIDRHLGRD